MLPVVLPRSVSRSEPGSKHKRAGFTLVDSVIAMGICGISIAVLYVAAAQAIRIVRSAREHALASQLLEQRFESIRSQATWTNVITVQGVKTSVSSTAPAANYLSNVLETYTVSPYPTSGASFTVTRNALGVLAVSGSSLSASQKAVKVTGRVSWGTSAQYSRERTFATILTRGGL